MRKRTILAGLASLALLGAGLAWAQANFSISGPITFLGTDFAHTGSTVFLIPTGTPGTYTKVTTDNKGRVISGTTITCSDVTNAGTVCPENTGTIGHVIGFLDGNKTDSGNNTLSGTNDHTGNAKFTDVIGRNRVETASTPLTVADCGKSVIMNSGSATNVTTFDATGVVASGQTCAIAVIQKGDGQVNFTAGAGTTLNNPIACTHVFGQYGIASLVVTGDAPTIWYLGGSCLP